MRDERGVKRPERIQAWNNSLNLKGRHEQQWEPTPDPNTDASTSTSTNTGDSGPYEGTTENIDTPETPAVPNAASILSSESTPYPYENIPVPIPPQTPDSTDMDTPWWTTTWAWSSTSTELTDVSSVTATTSGDSNSNGDGYDVEDLHSTLSGNQSIITYWNPTETDPVPLGVAGSQHMTVSPIIATSNSESSQDPPSSFFFSSSFPLTSSSPIVTTRPSQSHFAISSPTRAAAPISSSRALVSSSATISTASPASVFPHIEHKDGAMSSDTVRTIVGATVGGVAFLILVIFAILAYIQRASVRNLYSNMRFPSLLPKRNKHASSSPVIQSQENFFRREHQTIQIHARDLERATTVSSGSHYSDYDEDDFEHDMDENWHEIDVRDARSGKMQKDNGEWLESWRREKERMITMRQTPELHSNPDLPRPPITWGEEKRRL